MTFNWRGASRRPSCQLEVGESVVVRDRTIVGIEVANDSTDALLARVGRGATRSGVLVKWPFFDLEGNVRTSPIPKIGLKTAELANAANLLGIVIHPVTQVWNKAEVVHLLNENSMFLCVQEERNRQQ